MNAAANFCSPIEIFSHNSHLSVQWGGGGGGHFFTLPEREGERVRGREGGKEGGREREGGI